MLTGYQYFFLISAGQGCFPDIAFPLKKLFQFNLAQLKNMRHLISNSLVQEKLKQLLLIVKFKTLTGLKSSPTITQ